MKAQFGAQFLNTTSLSLLFGFAAGGGTGTIVTVPLTIIYSSLSSHKLDFSFEVLNLIWLSLLYVPRASLFIST